MRTYAVPEKNPTPDPERGVCVREGVSCYICEQEVANGEEVVLYNDHFSSQAFAYHASCWSGADLGAKTSGAEAVTSGVALILPEVRCAGCGVLIQDGVGVVRVAAGGRRRIRLIYHAPCFDGLRPS